MRYEYAFLGHTCTMKRFLIFLLCAAALLPTGIGTRAAQSDLSAKSAVLYEPQGGRWVYEKNADVRLENELVQQAVDAADCDIPEAMIESETDIMIREMQMRMMYQGLRFEDYLKFTGQTEEQVREMYKGEAKNRVKMQLVLEAMIKAEEIVPTEEEVEKAFAEEAERAGRTVEEFKASLNDRQKEYLKDNAAIRKVVDLIVETAEVEEKDEAEQVSVEDAMKAVEQVAEAADEE